MAEINFFEQDEKELKKSGSGVMLTIVFFILAGAALVYVSVQKTVEYTRVEQQKNELVQFIENADTKKQLNEYYQTQADITKIRNENMPVTQAYTDYRILNTVTGSLLDGYIWAPMKDNPDAVAFKSLTVAGNNLKINVGVEDVSAMRDYQADLIGRKINVDKDNIDKTPGSQPLPDDREINKFKDQFTTQITKQTDPNYSQPYDGMLSIFINKDITAAMSKLLGTGG